MTDLIRVSMPNKALVIPDTNKYRSFLGDRAKPFEHEGDRLLAVRHGLDETKLLRNIGLTIPSPLMHYDWRNSTPFDTQKATAEMLVLSPRAYVLSEMGTGKTRAILYAADWLMQQGAIDKVLIVAPLSTLTFVWWNEIFKHFPDRQSLVLYGTKKKRLQILEQDADFYIINHDGVGTIEKELHKKKFGLLVIDELASFRNRQTNRHKKLRMLAKNMRYAWGATGSPTPNEPCDAWGQCRILTPDRIPTYYKQFRESTMTQVSQFRWLPRPDANEKVYEAMRPAVRFTRDECVDLPDTTYTYRGVPTSPKQKLIYKAVRDHLCAEYEAGRVTAANAGVKLSKLLQISCGYVYDDNGLIVELDGGERLKVVKEIVEQNDHKTIIFVPFLHTVDGIAKFLKEGGLDIAVVTGAVNSKDRDRIFFDFQQSKKPVAIVAHPGTMSHGLTLTAASTIVWFGPTMSLETYEQANARITRPGQVNKSHIMHLSGTKAEKLMYGKLTAKQTSQHSLLELFVGIKE